MMIIFIFFCCQLFVYIIIILKMYIFNFRFVVLFVDIGYIWIPKTVKKDKMILLQEYMESVGSILLAPKLGKVPTHVLHLGEDNLIRLIPTTQVNEHGEEEDLYGLDILLKNHRTIIGTIRHGVEQCFSGK